MKPSATASFCRLTTGNSTTAVPMAASALITSSMQASSTTWSGPEPTMKSGLLSTEEPSSRNAGMELTYVST